MKPLITAIFALAAMLMISMPVRAATVPENGQPRLIQVFYPHPEYSHWHGACRDPRFRHHHPFLCW